MVAMLDIDDNKRVDLAIHRGFSAGQKQIRASEEVTIEYRPWMRHHAIITKRQTVMVPESWCTWTPA